MRCDIPPRPEKTNTTFLVRIRRGKYEMARWRGIDGNAIKRRVLGWVKDERIRITDPANVSDLDGVVNCNREFVQFLDLEVCSYSPKYYPGNRGSLATWLSILLFLPNYQVSSKLHKAAINLAQARGNAEIHRVSRQRPARSHDLLHDNVTFDVRAIYN